MASILITGGGKGLGRKAVDFIAARGDAEIVLAGRNTEQMKQVADDLRTRFGCDARSVPMDMSSLESVRDGACQVRELIKAGTIAPLSALMLNAGTQAQGAPRYSVDGYDMTFATNCLGPFLLANLLLDDVAEGGRVVWTASGTHDPDTADGKVVGKAVEPDAAALASTGKNGPALPGGVRYTTSKLCVILYSYELDRRIRRAGRTVASIAFDPGYVPETDLTRESPGFLQWFSKTGFFKLIFRLMGGTVGDLAFSGAGLGRVSVDEEYAGASGKFIQSKNLHLAEAKSSRASYDQSKASKLWIDSSRLVDLPPAP